MLGLFKREAPVAVAEPDYAQERLAELLSLNDELDALESRMRVFRRDNFAFNGRTVVLKAAGFAEARLAREEWADLTQRHARLVQRRDSALELWSKTVR